MCTCGKMSIGESRNWNPECVEHGIDTDWYQSWGKKKFQDYSKRTVEMQRIAGMRRRGEIDLEKARELLKELDDEEVERH